MASAMLVSLVRRVVRAPHSACRYLSDEIAEAVDVVYENEHAVVLEKPFGLLHDDETSNNLMAAARALQNMDRIAHKGQLYSVHRLDRAMSGVVLLAKSKDSASYFSRAFLSGDISKYYVAISNSKPRKKMGLVVGDIIKSRRSQWKLCRSTNDPAKSRFISKSFSFSILEGSVDDDTMREKSEYDLYSTANAPSLRAFVIKPMTEKTHQVRIMLRSLGSPALGDILYAPRLDSTTRDRCYVHSCALSITMPTGSKDAKAIQIVSRPKTGVVFNSPGFQSCWEQWALNNIVVDYSTRPKEKCGVNFASLLMSNSIIWH
mmetsp:Transcript_773/g.1287  ORF Transcript_773/g.1287 Transcript_773/m.1287 type:complete len:318 (-) Transcript_773:82-1035(-)